MGCIARRSRDVYGSPRCSLLAARCSALAIVVFADGEGLDLAGFQVVLAAVEAHQLAAVDVDLDGGAVAEVVEAVDLVHLGDQERDLARLDQYRAVLLKGRVSLAVPVINTTEARLLDAVAHHADHAPGVMVVWPHIRARTPDHTDHQQILAAVQHVAA